MADERVSVITLIDAATKICRGNEAQLARDLGITPQVVSSWKKGKRPIPPMHFARMAEMVFGLDRAKEMTWVYVTASARDQFVLCQLAATVLAYGRRATDRVLRTLTTRPRDRSEDSEDDGPKPQPARLNAQDRRRQKRGGAFRGESASTGNAAGR